MELAPSVNESADGNRRVAVLLDAEAETADGRIAEEDLETILQALRSLHYEPVVVQYSGDPAAFLDALLTGGFGIVFNLCEGLLGQAAGEHLPAAAVELLGIPMTGARSLTLGLCVQKDRTNWLLQGHGITVPEWTVASTTGEPCHWDRFPAIVKPVGEDASAGIHSHSVVRDHAELASVLCQAARVWDRMLVQRFIAGREFNLAIVAGEVLPHAEIDFTGLPPDLPAVVTYAAKWEADTPEYRGTVARCPAAIPRAFADRLTALADRVWRIVDGAGYGRVDVRVDERGGPFVIDINPNPDLSPAAGLARQARAAGCDYRELIARIIADAMASVHPAARNRYECWQRRRREIPA
jgi:D-alanine-D-alanine ligase